MDVGGRAGDPAYAEAVHPEPTTKAARAQLTELAECAVAGLEPAVPLSPVDDKPMQRASLAQLRGLLAAG